MQKQRAAFDRYGDSPATIRRQRCWLAGPELTGVAPALRKYVWYDAVDRSPMSVLRPSSATQFAMEFARSEMSTGVSLPAISPSTTRSSRSWLTSTRPFDAMSRTL